MKYMREILKELKEGLIEIYGDRLRRLVLYGSYARKEATEDSDVDVLMILDDFREHWKEIKRTRELIAHLSLKYDTLISLLPARERDFLKKKQSLYLNVKREGIAI